MANLNIYPTVLTSNTTLVFTSQYYMASAAGGTFTITLPDIQNVDGIWFSITRKDATSHSVIVTGTSGQTINGNTSILVGTKSFILVAALSNNWYILQAGTGV